jgi:hypothetical protein
VDLHTPLRTLRSLHVTVSGDLLHAATTAIEGKVRMELLRHAIACFSTVNEVSRAPVCQQVQELLCPVHGPEVQGGIRS